MKQKILFFDNFLFDKLKRNWFRGKIELERQTCRIISILCKAQYQDLKQMY